jgi:hypothetical protein
MAGVTCRGNVFDAEIDVVIQIDVVAGYAF